MGERSPLGLIGLAAVVAILIMFFFGRACAYEIRIQEKTGGYIADAAFKRLVENVAIFVRHNKMNTDEFRSYHRQVLLHKINATASLLPAVKDPGIKQKICELMGVIQRSLTEQSQRGDIDKIIAGRLREIINSCEE